MNNPDINVVFRTVKNGKFKGAVDCVFLNEWRDTSETQISCFDGQHGLGNYDYFTSETRTSKPVEYSDLLKTLKDIYKDYNLVIHAKMTKKFLKIGWY